MPADPIGRSGQLERLQAGLDTRGAGGYVLAMPVEQRGLAEFGLEYGAAFGEHIEAFDPALAKVLVRYNPDGNAAMNTAQLTRLARLSSWLKGHDVGSPSSFL